MLEISSESYNSVASYLIDIYLIFDASQQVLGLFFANDIWRMIWWWFVLVLFVRMFILQNTVKTHTLVYQHTQPYPYEHLWAGRSLRLRSHPRLQVTNLSRCKLQEYKVAPLLLLRRAFCFAKKENEPTTNIQIFIYFLEQNIQTFRIRHSRPEPKTRKIQEVTCST